MEAPTNYNKFYATRTYQTVHLTVKGEVMKISAFGRAKPVLLVAAALLGGQPAAWAGDPAYQKAVMTQIVTKVVYPKMAKMRSQEGVVVLVVSIGAPGTVTDVAVQTSSGVPSLDDAAIQAARDAAPYPAPPEGTAVINAKIKFGLDG
jgi:TonB family protein